MVRPFIFTFSCVSVSTSGIKSDAAGLELHCNDHTQAAVLCKGLLEKNKNYSLKPSVHDF